MRARVNFGFYRWVEMLKLNLDWVTKTIMPKCRRVLNDIDFPSHDTHETKSVVATQL
jgi:hypothetical protein